MKKEKWGMRLQAHLFYIFHCRFSLEPISKIILELVLVFFGCRTFILRRDSSAIAPQSSSFSETGHPAIAGMPRVLTQKILTTSQTLFLRWVLHNHLRLRCNMNPSDFFFLFLVFTPRAGLPHGVAGPRRRPVSVRPSPPPCG